MTNCPIRRRRVTSGQDSVIKDKTGGVLAAISNLGK